MSTQHPAKPHEITLDTLPQLFAHHRSLYGGFEMKKPDEEDPKGGDGGNDPKGAGGNDPKGDGAPEEATDDQGRKLGFPKDTPTGEMTPDQRAAYHRHQSRRHESRADSWKKAAGDREPDQLRNDLAELEKYRREGRTDADNAIEDARKQEREKVTREFGAKLAGERIRGGLQHLEDEDQIDDIIGALNLASFVTSDGSVDTDKVKRTLAAIAPGKGNKNDPDYGGGNHPPRRSPDKGQSAGKAEAARRFATKQQQTN